MDILDDDTGEFLVVRDGSTPRVALHIRGLSIEDDRVIHLSRQEARRLAALLLYQAERVGDLRLAPPAA